MIGKEVSRLDITIVTGGDDLRRASNAYMKLNIPSIFGLWAAWLGPTINLNHGVSWPGNSSNTVAWELSGQQIGRGDLFGFDLFYTSGQPDIFATQDNWNVQEIKIVAQYADGSSEAVFQNAGDPLYRFDGRHPRQTFGFQIAP